MTRSNGSDASNRRISLGFGGLSASAGDHIVHFYYTPQDRLDIQVPFLTEGPRGES